MLDALCQRYGQRPSNVIGIEDEIVAFDFDLTIMYKADSMIDRKTGEVKIERKSKSEDEKKRLKNQFENVINLQKKATSYK